MRVKSLQMTNFKRFTDLLIHEIPETARLVVLVGPNGSGKSSVFDGFVSWSRYVQTSSWRETDYYQKDEEEPYDQGGNVQVTLHSENADVGPNSLYVRTAYRNEADFSVRDLRRPSAPSDEIQRRRLVDDDKSVSGNYQRLIFETTSGVYDELNDEKTVRALREELVGKIQESMRNVFDDLVLQNISDPFGSDSHSGSFYFQKGVVNSFPYKNLSAGEKVVFDLLLDVHLKKKYFVDAIYCIDEVESHLHTQAQGKTLKELVAVLPSDSQLWVTTHSLGILRSAEELEHDSPGTVCILDFGEIEPDVATTLTPATLGKVAWDKLLSITLDDLSAQVAPGVIVVCEGTYSGIRRYNFDAEIYNRILGAVEHGIVFISGGSSEHIEAAGLTVIDLLSTILPNTKVVALRDRDDMSDDQVSEWSAEGNLVLPERNIETILFADDVLTALVEEYASPEDNVETKVEEAIAIKNDALQESVDNGRLWDDLKPCAGEIYSGLKRLLNLNRRGDHKDAFMRDTLARLVRPDMPTYEKLKSAIIDPIRQ